MSGARCSTCGAPLKSGTLIWRITSTPNWMVRFSEGDSESAATYSEAKQWARFYRLCGFTPQIWEGQVTEFGSDSYRGVNG